MSDFLVNLLRRGAGLPSVVVPRRPDLAAELSRLGDLENEDGGLVTASTNPPATEPVNGPGNPSTSVPAPSGHAQALSREHRAAPAADGEPLVVRAASLPVTPVCDEPPAAISPASPLGHARRGQQGTPGFRQPVSSSTAPAEGPVTPNPEVQSIACPTAPIPLAPRVAAPSEARAHGAASPLGHSAAHGVDAAPLASSPVPSTTPSSLPLTSIAASREAALQVLESGHGPVEPRIEVRIGRIEIRPAPASPPPAQAPRRSPRGFQGHALARRSVDRRWY